jgi:hypothetical protein
VNGNRAAALALARHAEDLTNSVVERARKTSPQGKSSGADAVAPLVLCVIHRSLLFPRNSQLSTRHARRRPSILEAPTRPASRRIVDPGGEGQGAVRRAQRGA